MTKLDEIAAEIEKSSDLLELVKNPKNKSIECGRDHWKESSSCDSQEDDGLVLALCPQSLIVMIVKVIAKKPNLFDDSIKEGLLDYFKTNKVSAKGLISLSVLQNLHKADSQLLTWIKYEILLIHLIKERIYEPKTMANEILALTKSDLPSNVATKFSSVLQSCLKYCREVNKGRMDEEEEEKWTEIIDWMSWFICDED